jgi:hypothetical protein
MKVKVTEIISSNTVVDPGTMMIESLYAFLARVTMSASSGHDDFTVRT